MKAHHIEGFNIVPVVLEDIPEVIRLAELGGLSRWSAADYKAELGRDDAILLKVSDAVNDSIDGFIVMRLIMSSNTSQSDIAQSPHAEILNITVRQGYRKKGLGSALICEAILASSSVRPDTVWLEVRCSNVAAIAFYEKLGFICEYTRKGLYSDPPEDGFVMKMNVSDSIST